MNRTINTAILGTTPKLTQKQLSGIFSFNGRRLDNGINMRVVSSNHDDLGSIDFDTFNISLQDGGGVLGKYYRRKDITIGISVSAKSIDELNQMIDEIKYRTSFTEGNLRILIDNVIRERTATCTSLKFNRQSFNVNRVGNVQLTFSCVNPHSQLLSPDAKNFITQTGTYSDFVAYDGRANSFPKLFVNIDSGTSEGMSFTLNGFKITITTPLKAGDIVIFDGNEKRTTVNDVDVVYSGPFTPLKYGENIFSIENDATFTGSLYYFTKYL